MDTMNLDYQKLATELLAATARKAVSSTPTTVYGHGSGGLFSSQGMERPVFSAMMLPRMGLQSMLPVRSNNATNPLYNLANEVRSLDRSRFTAKELRGIVNLRDFVQLAGFRL